MNTQSLVPPPKAPELRLLFLKSGFCEALDTEGLEDQPGLRVLSDHEAAGAILAEDPDVRLWMLYEAPESYLAGRMAEDTSPGAALADWSAQAGQLLSLVQRHRARCLLMPVSALEETAEAVAGLVDLPAEALAELRPDRPEADPLLALIARQALQSDFEIQALAGELDASCALSSEEELATLEALDRTYAAYRRLREESARATTAQFTAQISGLQQELEVHFLRSADIEHRLTQSRGDAERQAGLLKASQTEAQRLVGVVKQRDTELGQMRDRLAQLNQGLESYRVQIEAVSEEKGALLAEMAALRDWMQTLTEGLTARREQMQQAESKWREALQAGQRDLVTANSEKGALAKELALLRGQFHRAEAELAQQRALVAGIQASRSYRIMAPLRLIRARFRRGK